MGGAVFPPYCLAWGQTMVGVMATSLKRIYANTPCLPGLLQSVPLSPEQATVNPCLLQTPEHSLARLTQSLVGSLLLSPGSWWAQGFVCALQESVSPVLWKFCNQIPLPFKARFPRDAQSLCQIPRLRSLLWGLEFSQKCENFFGIIILQFVDHQQVAL